MSTCPAGHQSSADDYCDVCGLPIPAGGGTPSAADAGAPAPDASARDASTPAGDAVPADSGPESSACPNCQAVNPANALFCEACGYDFTTGTLPRPLTPPSSLDLDAPGTTAPVEDAAVTGERPAVAGSPVAESPSVPAAPVAPPLAEPWVAEVWIDPDWYADQDSSDPLPSAGLPVVVPLRTTSVLVGRTSRSRNIHPDIDLLADNGISRRHCQLTTDGTRWWVEDLGSSNGTYLGTTGGALPTQPIPAGEKREVAPDARLYLGAWTRIVLRKAQPGEI